MHISNRFKVFCCKEKQIGVVVAREDIKKRFSCSHARRASREGKITDVREGKMTG